MEVVNSDAHLTFSKHLTLLQVLTVWIEVLQAWTPGHLDTTSGQGTITTQRESSVVGFSLD